MGSNSFSYMKVAVVEQITFMDYVRFSKALTHPLLGDFPRHIILQTPKPGTPDKSARLFTLPITIYLKNSKTEEKKGKFTKINPELKHKIFQKATSPKGVFW